MTQRNRRRRELKQARIKEKMANQAVQDKPCEQHHWVGFHQPDLPIYWIDQCSQCHKFNAVKMFEEIEKAGYSKSTSQNVNEMKPVLIRSYGQETDEKIWGTEETPSR